MAESLNKYQPNYAVAPGSVLAEMLEARQISHAEFARRCGRSAKLVSEIIAAKAPIEPETALQFERVLGMHASVWLNIEANYQLFQAKKAEEQELAGAAEWAADFPIKDLTKLGAIDKPADKIDATRKLFAFFGVASKQAWEQRYARLGVAYRQSPSLKSSPKAVAAWLRLGELAAEQQDCADFSKSAFLHTVRDIRSLTTLSPQTFYPLLKDKCNEAGVAFVLVPGLSKTRVSGAARWLTPRMAIIQQSLRHKTNDHFWFTFFHEAAHILLHSKKEVFVDEENSEESAQEREANFWASEFLIPTDALKAFVARGTPSKNAIRAFARERNVAPGIVVGMLQHRNVIPWSHCNDLKVDTNTLLAKQTLETGSQRRLGSVA